MSHICDNDFSFGVKKLVVLVVCGHENIRSRPDRLAKKEAPGTAANGHIDHRLAKECGVANHRGTQLRLEQPKEISLRQRLFQPAKQPASNILEVVLQPVNIVCYL